MRRRHSGGRPPARAAALPLLMLVASCSGPGAHPETGAESVEGWFGLYRQPSSACSPAPARGTGSCPPSRTDCLRLRPAAGGGVQLQLYSVQAGEHVCVIDATLPSRRLPLTVDDPGPAPRQGATLRRDGDALVLSEQRRAGEPLPPFCGAAASVDGLRFTRAQRVADDGPCAPDL